MIVLPVPDVGVADVVDACIASSGSANFVGALPGIRAHLIQREQAYVDAASVNLHQYPKTDAVGALTNKEMKDAYTRELSGATGAAFDIYSDIKNSARNDRCPTCGVGVVSSLDHYLPKSKYSDLALTPANLVPSCNDCNKFKHIRVPKGYEDQTLHPYFDDFTAHRWLAGQVIQGEPPAVIFAVDSSGAYAAEDEKRLRTHLRVLRISRTYSSNAAQQLIVERPRLVEANERGGVGEVISYLADERDRYDLVGLNCWQSAFFTALAESDWFVGGGFEFIPIPA